MQEEEENAQREEKFPGIAWQQQSLFALLPEHKQALCVPAHGKIPAGIHPEGEVGKAVSAYHRPHLGNGKTRNDPNISVDFSSCPCHTQKELPRLCEVSTFVSRYFFILFFLGKMGSQGKWDRCFWMGKNAIFLVGEAGETWRCLQSQGHTSHGKYNPAGQVDLGGMGLILKLSRA